jgi:hypothetical protein
MVGMQRVKRNPRALLFQVLDDQASMSGITGEENF